MGKSKKKFTPSFEEELPRSRWGELGVALYEAEMERTDYEEYMAELMVKLAEDEELLRLSNRATELDNQAYIFLLNQINEEKRALVRTQQALREINESILRIRLERANTRDRD
jgi:hypothetical protein